MKLVDQVTRSFRVAKVFRENTDRINAIDFSPTGDLLVSSSDDDQIVIYDCEKGIQKSTLYSRKYGVDLVRFTHAKNAVIHGSTKVDDTIRYLSLHDNKYIRYFPGHSKKVVAVAMSPVDDTFLSASADKTLRLWDLRSPNCQGLMHLTGKAVAGFDPEGLVFAAGINSECVKLYDLRSFDKGPFITFKLSQEKECDWTGLKFSPDGKIILLSTNGSVVRLIDAFLGTPQQTLTGHLNNKGVPLEASFSPDSQCVFSGSTDGRVHVWNAETGYKISVLNADHPGPVQCIQFNPKFMMLASACTNMAFWLPSITEDAIVEVELLDGTSGLRVLLPADEVFKPKGTLYIRRRSQLLREHVKEDSALCKQYLRIRSQLLQQRYGVAYDQASLKSRSVSVSARSSSRVSESPDMQQTLVSPTSGLVPTNQAEASRAIVGGTTIAENYAFAGVHFIFDQHTDSVTLIKFANNDRSRLCCASLDGTLSICNVTESPAAVKFFLKGHKKGVTGFDWSVQNDLLISCSYDRTIRLWDANKGALLRTVEDQSGAEVLSVAFQPANNNVVVAGTSRGVVQVLNMSTGIYPKGGSSKVGAGVLALAFEAAGTVLWAGDEKGVIVSFLFEIATGRLSKCRRLVVAEDRPITSISYRAWISREARDPSLLISCAAGFLFLFRITDEEGGLKIRRKFPLRHRTKQLVRSTFCPLMSFRQGACVVSGSEDCCVYFFNIERDSKACVNKLQGHSSTVLGVTFNYDESLLATSDSQGLVIIWKREKRTGT